MDEKHPFIQNTYKAGMYDRPSVTLPGVYCQNIENMVVDRDTLKSRGGYTPYLSYAFPGEIQAIHQLWDSGGVDYLFVVSEGRIFRHTMSDATTTTPTEVTGGLTLSTSADARYVLRNWDGAVYGTDGVNPMFYIANGSSNAVLFSSLGASVPGRASAFEVYENCFWWGNFTDFDTNLTNRRYATIHSVVTQPNQYRAEEGARNDHDRQMAVQALMRHGGDLLAFQERAIRYITMDPAPTQLGYARTNFFYKWLSEDWEVRGLAAKLGAVRSRRGTFFVDLPGINYIPQGNPPSKPQYVGLPVETFWATVLRSRLPYAVCAAIPEKNGILFCVPYGSSATQNNRGIFFNIESWTDAGTGIEDVHPAFSIWKGADARPFAFNCLANIVDTDGRIRCLGGDYSGKVHLLDEGTSDNGTEIVCKWTPARIGDPNRTMHWGAGEVLIDMSLEAAKSIRLTQANYNTGMVDYSKTIARSASATPLGMFLLGTSVLGGETIGTARADLVGESRYTSLNFEVLAGSLPITVHQMVVRSKPGGTWGG